MVLPIILGVRMKPAEFDFVTRDVTGLTGPWHVVCVCVCLRVCVCVFACVRGFIPSGVNRDLEGGKSYNFYIWANCWHTSRSRFRFLRDLVIGAYVCTLPFSRKESKWAVGRPVGKIDGSVWLGERSLSGVWVRCEWGVSEVLPLECVLLDW